MHILGKNFGTFLSKTLVRQDGLKKNSAGLHVFINCHCNGLGHESKTPLNKNKIFNFIF